LAKFKAKYEVREGKLRCKLYHNIIISIKPSITKEELGSLETFFSLAKYNMNVEIVDSDHYLAIDPEGLEWSIRRMPLTTFCDDTNFGPLLPYTQEPCEYKWFLHSLQNGGIFIDVGANVGGYSIRACKRGSKVIAVEPDPDNYQILKQNLVLNRCPNTIVLNIASGSKEEVCQLYYGCRRRPSGYSLMKPEGIGDIKCSIEVKPLDAVIPQLIGDEWISLLKVDVEGLEVEVIIGALNILKRTHYLIVEVIPGTKSKMLELLQILKPLGFKVVDVVCKRFQPFDRTNVQSYCNLFLQKSA
jgi:FkbM family methyltransferase